MGNKSKFKHSFKMLKENRVAYMKKRDGRVNNPAFSALEKKECSVKGKNCCGTFFTRNIENTTCRSAYCRYEVNKNLPTYKPKSRAESKRRRAKRGGKKA